MAPPVPQRPPMPIMSPPSRASRTKVLMLLRITHSFAELLKCGVVHEQKPNGRDEQATSGQAARSRQAEQPTDETQMAKPELRGEAAATRKQSHSVVVARVDVDAGDALGPEHLDVALSSSNPMTGSKPAARSSADGAALVVGNDGLRSPSSRITSRSQGSLVTVQPVDGGRADVNAGRAVSSTICMVRSHEAPEQRRRVVQNSSSLTAWEEPSQSRTGPVR